MVKVGTTVGTEPVLSVAQAGKHCQLCIPSTTTAKRTVFGSSSASLYLKGLSSPVRAIAVGLVGQLLMVLGPLMGMAMK